MVGWAKVPTLVGCVLRGAGPAPALPLGASAASPGKDAVRLGRAHPGGGESEAARAASCAFAGRAAAGGQARQGSR